MKFPLLFKLVVCPRCGGEGQITDFKWLDESESPQAIYKTCPVCNGSRKIKLKIIKHGGI
jgi:DnaJ-class molecular chaperone